MAQKTYNVNGNFLDGIKPIPNNITPSKELSYLKNCYIKGRDGDHLFYVKDLGVGPVVLATLDSYAIIPLEDYDRYCKWKNRKKRVLNGGNSGNTEKPNSQCLG